MPEASTINRSEIRRRINKAGKRAKPEFLDLLEARVNRIVDAAINTHNGGAKTLDATVFGFVTKS